MKKKKIFYTLITTLTVLSFTLTGCGKTSTPPSEPGYSDESMKDALPDETQGDTSTPEEM